MRLSQKLFRRFHPDLKPQKVLTSQEAAERRFFLVQSIL
jgi:hypothetical protein